jgi:transposase
VLENKVIQAPTDTTENLCLDAAYVGREEVVKAAGYVPHIRPRGEEKKQKAMDPTFQPRRWVVELSHSWFNRFRKLATRYEKTDRSYTGLLMLAAAMITLNKVIVIYG